LDLALGIAVVFATFAGPVLAVCVARHMDDERRQRDRQMDIFRALMGSRRAALSLDRVKALNMIEIEFHGITSVENAYRKVMEHINLTLPLPATWADDQRKLITKLLSEMAQFLNYKLQQLDVLDGGYYPQAHADIEFEQQAVRQALIEVMSGRRPLLVSPVAPAPPAPFPPPPAPTVSKKHDGVIND